MTPTQATNFQEPAYPQFFICKIESPGYGVDRSSPGSSIHNEWLVNLMHATLASCSACGRSCLAPPPDHNEAIFLTDFCMSSSDDAPEHLTRTHTNTRAATRPLKLPIFLLGNSAQVKKGGEDGPCSPPRPRRDNHTPRQLLMDSEVLLWFQYAGPTAVLRAPWTSQIAKKESLIIHFYNNSSA